MILTHFHTSMYLNNMLKFVTMQCSEQHGCLKLCGRVRYIDLNWEAMIAFIPHQFKEFGHDWSSSERKAFLPKLDPYLFYPGDNLDLGKDGPLLYDPYTPWVPYKSIPGVYYPDTE